MSRDADMIVIGSGMGGLTAASLATQLLGWKVLVLERHWQIGGFTHAFSRKDWSWDVGLHYVGGLVPGSPPRQLFDLVTGGLDWEALPDVFDVAHLPDGAPFGFRADEWGQTEDLCRTFPNESASIDAHYRDLARLRDRFGLALFAPSAPPPLGTMLKLLTTRERALAVRTTEAVLNARFSDPRLKTLLACRWPDYGLPPSESAFGLHAMVLGSYAGGAGRPMGGARAIARSVSRIVEAGGGALHSRAEVMRISIEDGRVRGVEVRRAGGAIEALSAPVVVSDAGAWTTLRTLVGDLANGTPARPAVAAPPEAVRPRACAVTLYLGLDGDATDIGLNGANHWVVGRDRAAGPAMDLKRLEDGDAPVLFVSSASGREGSLPTAQVMAPVAPDLFGDWDGTAWRRRGAGYEALKERITEGLLAQVARTLPGLCARVRYRELSTPLTVANMTGHPSGAIYGLAGTPARFAQPFGARTRVRGLWLTGADICTPGIQGAMMGGVFAMASIMGWKGMPAIMAAARRRSSGTPR